MAKNTEGAVHLTSLDLDLTKFNEDIQHIQDSVAQVSDVSVQHLSQLREALNTPAGQMTFNANTQPFTQAISEATQATQRFTDSAREMSQTVESRNFTPTVDNIRRLAESLETTRYDADEAETRLTGFFNVLDSGYSKITFRLNTSGKRNVFQAVVDSANEAGQAIQKVYDLTEEGFPVIKTQAVDKIRQQTQAVNEQTVSVQALRSRFDALGTSARILETAIGSIGTDNQVITELVTHLRELQQNIANSSNLLIADASFASQADVVYRNLNSTLSRLWRTWNDVNNEARNATSETVVNIDQINRLAGQYATLSKNVEASKVSGLPEMQDLAKRARDSEAALKSLADQFEHNDITAREVTESYENLRSRLITLNTQFTDTARDQRSVIEANEQAKRENDALVKSFERVNSQYETLSSNVKKAKIPDIVKEDFLDRISKAQDNIRGLQQEIGALGTVSAKDTYTPVLGRIEQEAKSASEALDAAKQSQSNLVADEKLLESLGNSYESLQVKIAKTISSLYNKNIDNTDLVNLISTWKGLETQVESAAEKLRKDGIQALHDSENEFKSLSSSVNAAEIAISHMTANEGVDKRFLRLIEPIKDVDKEYNKLIADITKSDLDFGVKSGLLQQIITAQEEITKLKGNIKELSATSVKGDFDKQFDSVRNTAKSLRTEFEQLKVTQEEFAAGGKRVEDLNKKYAGLQDKLAGIILQMTKTGIETPEMSAAIQQARDLATEIGGVAESVKNSDYVSKEAITTFDNYSIEVLKVHTALNNAKESNEQYKQSLVPIQQQARETINSLKALEKTAAFKTQKNDVATLRAEYENFIVKLKTTGITADKAKDELAGLEERFKSLEASVNRGNTVIGRFVNKISETIKWRVSNAAISMVMRSFGGLTDTIIETENAVISLQRVLGDKSLLRSDMAQDLTDIAYEYGQTLSNVQETAVKFAQTGMNWNESLEATRVTMLALNTAELEVSTATDGLIAVMAQFGLESTELEGVIDKINKTADNFPITSQRIVEALQRAGGTAKAFGMSLDETIGVITALGKATGRAGSAIGTALNSLISFSMKGSSLEKFSEFLGKDVSNYKVVDLWKELAEAIKGGDTELAKMMSTDEEFSKLMDEDLASAIGLTEEYTKATEETNDMLSKGKDIYSTVGTYRQNYFIALLNNIDTAIAAINGMNSALGYSEQENVTAMEAFSKKWNQLIISAKELAIQFGNAGFLDTMKLFADIGNEALKITKNIGGLNTVLALTSALFLSIKKDNIAKSLSNVANTFVNLTQVVNVYNTAMSLGYTRIEAFKLALSGLQLTAGGIVAVISLAVVAIGEFITANQRAEEEAKQAREEAINAGKESVESINSLTQAYKEYRQVLEDSSSTTTQVNDSREKMIGLLGLEQGDVEILINRNKDLVAGYEDADAVIKTLAESEYALAKASAEVALQKTKEKIANTEASESANLGYISNSKAALLSASEIAKELQKTAEGAKILKDAFSVLYSNPTADTLKDDIEKLSTALEYVQENYQSSERSADSFYEALAKQLGIYNELKGELESAQSDYESLGDSFDDYVSKTTTAEEANSSLSDSASGVSKSLEEIEKVIENLNKKMDGFQSAIKTVHDVVDQYNESGIMTADMLQSLIELAPEYIDLIDINSGALSVNQEKLENLMKVNDNYMIQLAAMSVQKQYEALSTELQKEKYDNLTASEITNALATEALGGEVYQLAMQVLTGEKSVEAFNQDIQDMASKQGLAAEKAVALGGALSGLTGNLYQFLQVANMSASISAGVSNLISGKTVEQWLEEFDKGNITGAKLQSIMKRYYAGDFDKPKVTLPSLSTPSSGIKTWMPSTSSKSKSSGSSGSKTNTDPYKEEKDALKELLEVYEHSIFMLEKHKDEFTSDFSEALQEATEAYNEEMRLVAENNIDLTKTVFGNIDTNNRQVIGWTEENLERFKDAYESLGYTAEELRDSISTIMGSSAEYDGVEIAYTPILQTSDGPKLLDQDTVDQYIWGLIEQTPEGWTNEDLLRLDAEGLEIDGQRIKNLIADIGETAIHTGVAMHYVGEMGSVAIAERALKEAKSLDSTYDNNRTYAEKVVEIYRKMQEAVHAQAEKYRADGIDENDSMIRNLQEQWWDYQDKIEEVLQGIYDETVKAHKNAINVLEHEYESAEQRLDYSYMGENLKKQLDYQVKIQKEAERELERLAKLGTDANSDAAQDVIDTWYDAEKAVREIGQKIAADILDPFDDFIDLADHFELWEYMDFTKVDYLRDKLAALNGLLEEGVISAKEYGEQLKSISYAIYDAQKEFYEKQQKEIQDETKKTTEAYKKQLDVLKKEKDNTSDSYDKTIDGYEKEIKVWEKKKKEVEKYYDTLIDNLKSIEKANERINKQVDYYNSRQKIITNLEQAQARSGVEWREKEMEYQQQLIDLDEEWRRTMEEWSVEDQIEALEKLKDIAVADIDLSIEKIRDTITMTEEAKTAAIEAIEAEINAINDLITAAEESAEAQIEVINDKIKEMSAFIAEAIKNGTVDGLVDSREEFDKSLVDGTNAMLDFIDQGKTAMTDSASQTANDVYGIYFTNFISPMATSVSDLASSMAVSITSGAEEGAKQALSTFHASFVNPLKQEMANLMKDINAANTAIVNSTATSAASAVKKVTTAQLKAFNSGAGPVAAVTPSIATPKPSFNSDLIKAASNNIYITNINRSVEDAVSKTQRTLASLGYK